MHGFLSKCLGVALCIFMYLCLLGNVMISDLVQDRRSIVAEVTNFIDEVTDTGVLDEKRVADLYLGVSAYGPVVDVQIMRYIRVMNPDPNNPGEVYTTYVASDNIYQWGKGDLVKVITKEVGPSNFTGFIYSILKLSTSPVDFTLVGRVRV